MNVSNSNITQWLCQTLTSPNDIYKFVWVKTLTSPMICIFIFESNSNLTHDVFMLAESNSNLNYDTFMFESNSNLTNDIYMFLRVEL